MIFAVGKTIFIQKRLFLKSNCFVPYGLLSMEILNKKNASPWLIFSIFWYVVVFVLMEILNLMIDILLYQLAISNCLLLCANLRFLLKRVLKRTMHKIILLHLPVKVTRTILQTLWWIGHGWIFLRWVVLLLVYPGCILKYCNVFFKNDDDSLEM